MADKLLLALSGGVDSAVAAGLMVNAGFDCVGATILNTEFDTSDSCKAEADTAKCIANKLGIPHYVFNFSGSFREKVIEKFISEYEHGRTPNPCIECNYYMKFGTLLEKMTELSCDKIVTGHYAKVEYNEKYDRYVLKRARNTAKDQTYFLYRLNEEQLSKIIFPLGNIERKDEIRALAKGFGFENSQKKESQDICFIKGDYFDFIEKYGNKKYPYGNFVDTDGNILGKHKGIIRYTIGQRKGLGLALPEPLYVKELDMKNNNVILSRETAIFSKGLIATDFNFIVPPENIDGEITAKTRYTRNETPCKIESINNNTVKIEFEKPVRAITPGQSVVLYCEDVVVGGGIIETAL